MLDHDGVMKPARSKSLYRRRYGGAFPMAVLGRGDLSYPLRNDVLDLVVLVDL